MNKTINADRAPAAVGPYAHAVQSGGLLFVSGQLGIDPQTGTLPDGIEAQTEQSLKNVCAVLEAAGYTPEDVVKTTVLIGDMGDFGTVNEIYAGYFKANKPARSCFQVAALPKGGLIEIEVIASRQSL